MKSTLIDLAINPFRGGLRKKMSFIFTDYLPLNSKDMEETKFTDKAKKKVISLTRLI